MKGEVKVINKLGLHARPANLVMGVANRFVCNIFLSKENVKVSAKDIMGVLMLAAEKGAVLILETKGEDEVKAFEAIKELFKSGFSEVY